MAVWARYSLLVDWFGTGGFPLGTRTGGSATQFASSTLLNTIVVPDGDHTDTPASTQGEWYDFFGNRISDRVHTVTAVSAAAFGFRNLTVTPDLPRLAQNGDTFWVITPNGVAVTDDQLAGSGMAWSYGRDSARSSGRSKPGEGNFSLRNDHKRYSPENASSLLAGDIVQARPVRISAAYGGTVYTLFRGVTDDFRPSYGRNSSVELTLVDGLASLAGLKVTTGLHNGIRTGDAINLVLDAAGWAGGRRIDAGVTLVPWFWLDGEDALEAINRLVDSEGLPSYAGCDQNGNFVFLDRYHRHLTPASQNVQATWRDAGTDPRFSLPLSYDHGAREVVNSVDWDVEIRNPGPISRVWEQTSPITLANGETEQIVAKASEPFYDLRTPTVGYDPDDETQTGPDIDLKSGTITVSVDRTSGQSVTLTITATSGPVVIDSLSIRARPVPVTRAVKAIRRNEPSVSKYGQRYPEGIEPKWASQWDARSVATILVGHRAERLPTIGVTFKSGTPAILTEQLARDLSDRVRVIYPEASMDRHFYVERATHRVRGRGADRIHETTFEAEAVPVGVTNPFILGTSSLGGTDQLVPEGYVDSSLILIVGDSSRLLGTHWLTY